MNKVLGILGDLLRGIIFLPLFLAVAVLVILYVFTVGGLIHIGRGESPWAALEDIHRWVGNSEES